jgi:hypothetical protein
MIEQRAMNSKARAALLICVSAIACGEDPPQDTPPPAAAGSLEVTWKLVNPAGDELDCADLGFIAFQIRIGADPIRVICGDQQILERDRLTPGRYPLVIVPEIFQGQTADQYAYRTNLDVKDMEKTVHVATITIDPTALESGNLDIRWRIEGMAPASGCAAIGADLLHVETDEGSIEDFEIDLPCALGLHRLEQKRRGGYTLLVSLRDQAGSVINSLIRRVEVSVVAGETATADINFEMGSTTLGSLETTWTISSSVASVGCPEVAADYVEVTVLTEDPNMLFIPVVTATAGCTRGTLGIERIPVANFYRVRYDLIDIFGTVIRQVIQEPVAFLSARTTTTAVDFRE